MTPTGDADRRRDGSELLWSVGVWVLAAFSLIALGLEADAAGAAAPTAFLASSLSCAALPVALRRPIGVARLASVCRRTSRDRGRGC